MVRLIRAKIKRLVEEEKQEKLEYYGPAVKQEENERIWYMPHILYIQ